MENRFGEKIRALREERNLLLRELAAKLEMDVSLLSKIETNNRIARMEIVEKLASIFKVDVNDLLIYWYSDKIVTELQTADNIGQILRLVEQKLNNGDN